MPLTLEKRVALEQIALKLAPPSISKLKLMNKEFASAILKNDGVQQHYYSELYKRLCKLDVSLPLLGENRPPLSDIKSKCETAISVIANRLQKEISNLKQKDSHFVAQHNQDGILDKTYPIDIRNYPKRQDLSIQIKLLEKQNKIIAKLNNLFNQRLSSIDVRGITPLITLLIGNNLLPTLNIQDLTVPEITNTRPTITMQFVNRRKRKISQREVDRLIEEKDAFLSKRKKLSR